METSSKIYVAGHRGLVGSAIVRNLKEHGFNNIVTRTHKEMDLTNQSLVEKFFKKERPEYVFVAAAKVGGILFNQECQADFLSENLSIATNVLNSAAKYDVKKLLYLGSSCIYPRMAPQPIKEEYLLSGPLEPTNEGYALAKIAGLKLCEKFNTQYGKHFIAVMPTNLYGPHDNYHPEHSHVIPGLIRKFHEAKVQHKDSVTIWGTGKPLREFLYIDDLAEALFVLMQKYNGPSIVNIGTGKDCTIKEIAEKIKNVVGFDGEILFDETKPDGMPRKLLNIEKISSYGWKPQVSLNDGLEKSYKWAVKEKII